MDTKQVLGLAALGLGLAALAALVKEEHRETRRVLTTVLRGVQSSVDALAMTMTPIADDAKRWHEANEAGRDMMDEYMEDMEFDDLDDAVRYYRLQRKAWEYNG